MRMNFAQQVGDGAFGIRIDAALTDQRHFAPDATCFGIEVVRQPVRAEHDVSVRRADKRLKRIPVRLRVERRVAVTVLGANARDLSEFVHLNNVFLVLCALGQQRFRLQLIKIDSRGRCGPCRRGMRTRDRSRYRGRRNGQDCDQSGCCKPHLIA